MATVSSELKAPKGQPFLRVILECPEEVSIGSLDGAKFKIKVAYERVDDGSPDPPPITLHNYVLVRTEAIISYRLGPEDGWKECDLDDDDECGGGFMLVDSPPKLVHVNRDEHFFSLRCGEAATTVRERPIRWLIPPRDDPKSGDRFRLVFSGASVEWWDWGGPASHENTEVYLPCWTNGPVLEPPLPVTIDTPSDPCPQTDNGGRPKLVVGASEPAEFILVA